MFEVQQTESFQNWLDRLRDEKAQKHVLARIRRISLGNFGDVKPVGKAVSEIRIDHGPGYRLYYMRRGATIVLLLIGGDKRSQKQDIERALAMAEEIRSEQ
jgi:putative addiction module killer protein